MIIKNILITKIFILLMILLPHSLYSHDNENVHPGITYRSIFLNFQNNSKYTELMKHLGNATYGSYTGIKDIAEGSYGEDKPMTRGKYPFYHYGSSGRNGLSFCGLNKSAFETAQQLWKKTINDYYDYKDSSKNISYFTLGRVVHLLQDMSVPAHVQNDDHINPDIMKYPG